MIQKRADRLARTRETTTASPAPEANPLVGGRRVSNEEFFSMQTGTVNREVRLAKVKRINLTKGA